jgi:hypothetical protein
MYPIDGITLTSDGQMMDGDTRLRRCALLKNNSELILKYQHRNLTQLQVTSRTSKELLSTLIIAHVRVVEGRKKSKACLFYQ